MKNHKFFVSTLIAAAAMTAPAYAEEIDTSGKIISSGENVSVEQIRFTESGTLTIEKDATLSVTGNIAKGEAAGSATADRSSFSFGEVGTATINVAGTLNLLNANGFGSTWSTTNMTIDGVANLKALTVYSIWTNNNSSSVTLNEGGVLNIGSGGYQKTYAGTDYSTGCINLKLNGGTLGALDNWSTSDDIFVNGAVTLNTTKYDASSAEYLSGDNSGATITLGGKLVIGDSASLTVSGSGKLNLVRSSVDGVCNFDESVEGLVTGSVSYSLALGSGSLSGLTTSNLTINGDAVSSVDLVSKTAVSSSSVSIYNVVEGSTTVYADVANDISQAAVINVLGTLDFGTGSDPLGTESAPLNLTGTGTIKYVWSPDNAGGSGIHIADGFKGVVDYTGGINWPGSWSAGIVVGDLAVLRFSSREGKSAPDEMWGNTAWSVVNAVEFGTDYTINLSGANLTFENSVNAVGHTLKAYGGNVLTFKGKTTLGALNVESGTVTFEGEASIGSLTGSATFKASSSEVDVSANINQNGRLTFVATSVESFGNDSELSVAEGGAVEFELSDSASREFAGDIVLKNGAELKKKDGTLKLSGSVQLGASESDSVYLLGNWFKDGTEISGVLSGAGTAYVSSMGNANTNATLGRTDAEVFTISGSDNSYSGTLVVGKKNADEISGQKTILVVSADTALQNAKVNLAGGEKSEMKLVAQNVTIAGLDGVVGSKITGDNNYRLTINGGGNFAGSIAPGGVTMHLVKTGAGTLTLSGTNAYSGGTTIEAGTLVAGCDSALGSESVKVSGGKLEVSSGVTVSNVIEIVLNSAYTTEAAIQGEGTLTSAITVSGDLDALVSIQRTIAQQYEYQLLSNTLMTEGVTVTLSRELALAIENKGWSYDYDTTSGMLTLTIPEPSAFGLLAGLGAVALCVSRRRRVKKA